ncbi:DNA-binding transcriptional regulator LsrR (DeoR family) [Leifsonia naganoensis]|uniref:DNA-binding transcriptional regulator LsrR (DeoR family) n=2 Tax=Leifsonia naganoensis TaxID=150025 RepID=A0A853DKY3_9MICO|nr:DNA-binding transcriptional regulator LsrR (DeoR family) [Leifsonia naganoensis]
MMMGPDELVQISHVARRFYLENASQVAIADELGISRFKVARLLEKAVKDGVVTITIQSPPSIDLDLSIGLRNAFGLSRALAVPTPNEDPAVVQDQLGSVAAQLLEEIAFEGAVLGFTAGRTLNATTLHLTRLPYCEVVALGGVAGPVKEHGVEVIRRVGEVTGGPTFPIFAPLFVASAPVANALRVDRGIAQAYAKFPRVDIGMVAVGSWAPPDSQLYDAASEAGIAEQLLDQGVVGEVGATLFTADGTTIDTIDDRSIAITGEQLRRIPEVIAVAGGRAKTRAIRAALNTGMVNSLVTDASTAQRLLESST